LRRTTVGFETDWDESVRESVRFVSGGQGIGISVFANERKTIMNRSSQLIYAILFTLLFGSFSSIDAQTATDTTAGMTRLSHASDNSADPVAVADDDPRVSVYQNIVALGAIGDGVADNTAVLQAAINNGASVMIPEGVFNFSGTLTLKKDGTIFGIGKKSVLRYTGTDVAMREPQGAYQGGYDNLKLSNFTLTTNSASQAGIELTNNYQVTMSGLFIDGATMGFQTAGLHIIGSTNATNSAVIRFIDGEIWLCVGDGIRVSGPGGAAGLWIERNHITGNGLGVNQVIPDGAWPTTNWHINNNVIEANYQGAIQAQVLYASSIRGNYFENIDGSNATMIRIGEKGYAQGVDISGNLFGGKKAEYNIDMNGPADITGSIRNNLFAGASVAAIRVNMARGLTIDLNTPEPGTVTKLVALSANAKAVWIRDADGEIYVPEGSAATENLTGPRTVSDRAQSTGMGEGRAVESRTMDGTAYAAKTAMGYEQASDVSWTSGAGAPKTACNVGSLFSRTDGGANSSLYLCEPGGWVAK
jgi:hypothetical protein